MGGGKVCVVTGSSRGIGWAIADALAAAGHTVVISSRSADAVAARVAELESRGARCSGFVADVASNDDLEALLAHTLDRWGRLDCWVNNAGISLGYRPLDEIEPADVAAIVSINLTGLALGTRLAVRHFRADAEAGGPGGIVLNLTGRGYRGDATPYTALYASTKAAIASLTQSVAAENKNVPVTVSALLPGMVATDFYEDIEISPRLVDCADNWRYALDAFGVEAAEVGALAVKVLELAPGVDSGRIHSAIGGLRTARGIVKITGHRMSGRLRAEP
jgi:NAD(P)-dependent dehydrogenase (short-subunit alcohol dehydrogenase family)